MCADSSSRSEFAPPPTGAERLRRRARKSPPFPRCRAYHPSMPQSDCLQILLSHDRWATTQLLDACGSLTPDQFHRRFDIGPGSLHDTITHIIGAMRTWTDSLA